LPRNCMPAKFPLRCRLTVEADNGELSGVPADSAPKEAEREAHAGAVLRTIWPTVMGLFFSGTCGLLIFPFLTYVPSDGMLGELLPKVSLGVCMASQSCPKIPRPA